ncbi:MAG: DUF3006 domain-containing protein [Eubacteriales bacterium]
MNKGEKMTLKLVIDRFEDDIAVCLDFDDKKYEIDRALLPEFEEKDVFNIEYDGGRFHSPVKLTEETEARKRDVSNRMKKLFNMSRHTKPPKI